MIYKTALSGKNKQPDKLRQRYALDISEVKHQAEDFSTKNKMKSLSSAALLIALVGRIFGYRNLLSGTSGQRSHGAVCWARFLFDKDSFDLALNNPGGGFAGFKRNSRKLAGAGLATWLNTL
ncbi:MAG: hypothetical protein U0T81_00405 [Saprospiraceae bacterium]